MTIDGISVSQCNAYYKDNFDRSILSPILLEADLI